MAKSSIAKSVQNVIKRGFNDKISGCIGLHIFGMLCEGAPIGVLLNIS